MQKKNINLDRRTVLISGITSGIGNAVALKFAAEGWDIIGHYNSSKDKASILKKQLQTFGSECCMLRGDLKVKQDVIRLSSEIEDSKIDSLINNAGTYTVSRHFSELSIDDLTNTFMVNAFAPIILTTKAFVRMKENGFGRIVNISSIAAKYGGSTYSLHYGASKMALESLTKTLAREGAPYNVLVNTVRPGIIDTDFHKKFPKDIKKRVELIPMKKMGEPDDVAEMVYYLGSEKNNYITGEIMTIAGGE